MSDAKAEAIRELESAILRISAAMPSPLERNAASDLRTVVYLVRAGESRAALFYLNRWLDEDHLEGEARLALIGRAAQIDVISGVYLVARKKALALRWLLTRSEEVVEPKELEPHERHLRPPAGRIPETPRGWKLLEKTPSHMGASLVYRHDRRSLLVILSYDPDDRVEAWIHASISHPKRTPTYDELAEMKRLFIGDEHTAYQIFPVREEHVNLHEHCLHLWSPVGHDPLEGSRRFV